MLQDKNSLRHKLNERHTKAVKDNDAEVETGIWDNATSGVMGEDFSSERHGTLFDSLMNRITRQFKTNILNRFIRYTNLIHGLSVRKYID